MNKSTILALVVAVLGFVGVLRAAQPNQAPAGCCDGGACCPGACCVGK